VAFKITPGGEVVRLTTVHDKFLENSVLYGACKEAWPVIRIQDNKNCLGPAHLADLI
jgi:hypothetical protein